MKITYHITRDDFIDAQKLHRAKGPRAAVRAWRLVAKVVAWVLMLFALAWAVIVNDRKVWADLMPLFVLWAVWTAIWVWIPFNWRRCYAKDRRMQNEFTADISEDGIHWKAVRQAALIIKGVGARSPHGQGNFNFAAIAMLKPYGPFYPGAWHPGGGPRSFAIGLEAANVVMDVFSREHDPRTAGKALTDALSIHLRAVEAAAMKTAEGSGWTYAGIDPTPAPGGAVSIGTAIESFVGAPFGSPGTETAAGIITRSVKNVPVKQTGYSGLMIPVLEDTILTRRWTEGTYGLDSILAYSAVCAGGVDTVPLAGDTTEEVIARIVGDVATLAFKWNKPLAARLLPAPGKKTGEMTEFSGALANTIIQPLIGSPRR